MDLKLNIGLVGPYQSNSQIARVLTEGWVKENSFCPNCGEDRVIQYPNNQPVADFFCASCKEEFELKSKNGKLGNKIIDGAYSKMIERVKCENNPNFFFLTYSRMDYLVNNFLIIPKHFFRPEIIERRKPLAETAKRAKWVGCNIYLQLIPEIGRIFLIKNSVVIKKIDALDTWSKTVFLRDKSVEAKGWTLDILKCLDQIKSTDFSLNDVYAFEEELKTKYPSNNTIKDQMRKQLQILRDMNIIEFVSRGRYRKIK